MCRTFHWQVIRCCNSKCGCCRVPDPDLSFLSLPSPLSLLSCPGPRSAIPFTSPYSYSLSPSSSFFPLSLIMYNILYNYNIALTTTPKITVKYSAITIPVDQYHIFHIVVCAGRRIVYRCISFVIVCSGSSNCCVIKLKYVETNQHFNNIVWHLRSAVGYNYNFHTQC